MSMTMVMREAFGNVRGSKPEAVCELTVGLAFSPEDVRAAQQLRRTVFAAEAGLFVATRPDRDADAFDPFCQHVIVRDQAARKVIASSRVLLDGEARLAGGFAAEARFDIRALREPFARIAEIGRTCIHGGYRADNVLDLLWSGIARFIDTRDCRYIISCVSVPMGPGGANALSIHALLKDKGLVHDTPVAPVLPLPERAAACASLQPKPSLPPVLKSCLRLGARVGGEPCWDPRLDRADLLLVMSPRDLLKRYAKHLAG